MAEVPELTIERMKADFKALEEEAAFGQSTMRSSAAAIPTYT